MFDWEAIKRSVKGLAERRESLQQEVDKLTRERVAVRDAPPTREDVKELIGRWLREAGAEHMTEFRGSVAVFARNGTTMTSPQRLRHLVTLGATDQHLAESDAPSISRALCAFFAPQMLKAAETAIDAMDWPELAIGMDTRAQRLEQLDARIVKLQAEIADIEKHAAAAGITF